MHPAFSVLIFTVCSGAGYGLLVLLSVFYVAGIRFATPEELGVMGAVGLTLIAAGLFASTFHLANPKNAWRSFTRFRSSWLSREAVFAVIHFPIACVLFLLLWRAEEGGIVSGLAIATLVLSFATLISTAMIYASLKTIPQWHNPFTVISFLVLASVSGATILLSLQAVMGHALAWMLILVLVFLAAGLVSKLLYFKHLGKPVASSINSATQLGCSVGGVRLLETGHSGDNFLQKEFICRVGPKTTRLARYLCCTFAFILPAVLLLVALLTEISLSIYGSVVSVLLGVMIERWLFFIEAKHVIRLYYGETSG